MSDQRYDSAVRWLLSSGEPAIRYLTRRDVRGEDPAYDPSRILRGPKVSALLSGQGPDGGFGVHPYRKWTGAHWRLVSLVELAAPPDERRIIAAARTVLDWITSGGHRSSVPVIGGLARRCASQEGNALAVLSRLGLAGETKVEALARSLVEWQWPDGGWNCDVRATGRRSSFHESLAPMWGLHEFSVASGAGWARAAAERTAELFLEHRVFRSLGTGQVINRQWLTLRYPPYWHYDVLQALLILARLGRATDPRTDDAFEVLLSRRLPDGRWRPGRSWWNPPGSTRAVEAVDWGRTGPNEMLTLNALRALRAAGRLDQPAGRAVSA